MISGDLRETETRIENTLQHGGSNMWGVGSTLEGFGINPVMYEYVFEKVWNDGKVNVDEWVNHWATRRYGGANNNAGKAWEILLNTAYAERAGLGRATLTNSRPVFKDFQSWTTNPSIKYDNRELLKAWNLLNQSKATTDVYEYDLVNVAKQVLGNYFKNVRDDFTDAYERKDVQKLKEKGDEMISLMKDIDTILGSNKNSLVGAWIESARSMAATSAEKKYFEQNARKILTVWGEKGGHLVDYANRSWAGLTKTYYGERWKMFVNDVIEAVQSNKTFDDKQFSERVKDFEEKWAERSDKFAQTPEGNSLAISRMLYKMYAQRILNKK